MNTWSIYYEDSNGDWIADTAIPRPNDDMSTNLLSTQQKVKLADGSNAFITPETKSEKETFDMFFANASSTFRTQITDYITSGTRVKIVTHNSETYIGYFLGMTRVWFAGISPDEFDITLTFQEG